LKNGVNFPVSGSIEAMSEPLNRLQQGQDNARFSASVMPSCFSAMICSISKEKNEAAWGDWQY